jgi:hypothetical protein
MRDFGSFKKLLLALVRAVFDMRAMPPNLPSLSVMIAADIGWRKSIFHVSLASMGAQSRRRSRSITYGVDAGQPDRGSAAASQENSHADQGFGFGLRLHQRIYL